MATEDEAGRVRGMVGPRRQPRGADRVEAFKTGDDQVVLYDIENATAWIQSDCFQRISFFE